MTVTTVKTSVEVIKKKVNEQSVVFKLHKLWAARKMVACLCNFCAIEKNQTT